MDRRLLQAARSGDTTSISMILQEAQHEPSLLIGTTPEGNTCLHIASAHGHLGFCTHILEMNKSLLDAVNADGETPLLAAVRNGQVSLASFLLSYCRNLHMSATITKQDKHGCNALHHAIRSGHEELALALIQEEPALAKAVNKYDESPMFIAVMRNFTTIFEKLLEIPDSADGGTYGYNALYAAFRNNNADIAKKIVQARPKLARQETNGQCTAILCGVLDNKIGVLRVLLEYDFSLGYQVSTDGAPLLNCAAYRGHVEVAREILKHCPDAPFLDQRDGCTCLHKAVNAGQTKFVEFVVQSNKLRKIINIRDKDGDTALHYAIRKCYPKIVAILLKHQYRDVTMLSNSGCPPIWVPDDAVDHAKTLNWNEVSMLMLEADPEDKGEIYNLNKSIKHQVIEKSRKDIRSLTQTYANNTSLVAILIATITFAAAFTLPGGYSNDVGSKGLPIMGRKLAFQAFLIFDTLAMCTSLTVAFICIIARWEDLEFLLYYRSFTKKLMWFAYMATTAAFATGLYTVLAPHLPWLAIAICVVSFLLPFITKLVGEWPILKLRIRLRGTFESELLDLV
ncbi:ankyrin repeat-containing protein At5g02620-like [Oryza brachyantha]|nr:ankyrin repeat-containing protein At5g02620-like [Oryza brachyantha]